MEAALLAFAHWLEAAGVGPWGRSGSWAYPFVNSVHLLGLVMLVGGIGVVDLRLAGLWRSLPAGALSRALTPVALCGLALLFRLVWQRRVEAGGEVPPLIGRTSALASLAMWLGVGTLGRLIAYS
ncbi:MAG: hypothetical protein MT490_02760 [Sphingomonas sp.]|uniref:hypothetical protein n=1 Tax=Sphingomonas sp. TaxID=28214 RepID=UPI00227659F5|nr:hypothetical protein [Sphingomonas sp.]MCX8474696.1 hypothetical protein [Sphingomonas sp.]